MIGTAMGAGVFLVLLLFATQVLFGLYVTSVVGAVAYDAAKSAAGADAGVDAAGDTAALTQRARDRLGALGPAAAFSWRRDDDRVALTVRIPGPGVLPPFFRRDVVRTVRVRVERVR
ncbi:MAG TPA: hypothetical protein VFA94_13410 [Acidimicrobiales bacterium]|nr:hypothetical protein [Acidimicrobiales bacterium]